MTTAHIRFSTEILRRLGEELNPSVSQGILELVKNAYDADATHCTVSFQGTDAPGGSIRVIDSGGGMTAEDILHGWLVLGSSTKTAKERTPKGRIPAGNKGLGRLAALRLGTTASIVTRPRTSKNVQYRLDIDWRLFDKERLVDDVDLDIVEEERPADSKPGTEIMVSGLHDRVGRMEVKRLARSMVLLADPFGDDPQGFRPALEAPEFKDLEQLVQQRYFSYAPHHLRAELDEHGSASAVVSDWRGNVLWEADSAELTKTGPAHYDCVPASFDLWAFKMNEAAFRQLPVSLTEVREWVNAFGGVHLYVNGLKAGPYGEVDWLNMNLARVRSPEERPGTNTSIGRIALIDTEETLSQKTDRSGFIENEAFDELRRFAVDSLEFLAKRRLEQAEERRRAERAQAAEQKKTTVSALETAVAKVAESEPELKDAFTKFQKAQEAQVKTLRKEVQLYRTLATAGITAATYAHEAAGNPLKALNQLVGRVERIIKDLRDATEKEKLLEPIQRIRRAVQALGVLPTATLQLIDADKRREGRVDLHQTISSTLKTLQPFIEGRNATVQQQFCKADLFLLGSEAAVESIVTNLVNNALAAFEVGAPDERRILVETDIEGDRLILRVSDTGPGIVGLSVRDIFLPGETTVRDGTGLGLTIVRDSVTDLGGEVRAEAQGPLGGARLTVEFPALRR